MTEQVATESAGRATAIAYLLLIVAMLSWAGNIIVGRALSGEVPPLGLSLMRWFIAFVFVLPLTARELLRKRFVLLRDWQMLLLLGLLGVAICNSLTYIGLQSTTAVNAALVNAAGPMVTLGVTFLFYREVPGRWQTLGLVVSLSGMVLVVLRGDVSTLLALSFNRGDLLILLGVVCWSLYTVLLRRRPAELSPLALLAVLFAIGTAVLLPLHFLESLAGNPLPASTQAIAGYLFVGLFPAAMAFLCWNRAVAVVGATRAIQFNYLLPLFAAAMAMLFLGERIALFHILGGGLIFLGIFLANLGKR